MGSSKKSSTSTYDLAGLKEYRQPLVNQLPRLEFLLPGDEAKPAHRPGAGLHVGCAGGEISHPREQPLSDELRQRGNEAVSVGAERADGKGGPRQSERRRYPEDDG